MASAPRIAAALRARGEQLAVAESCTGGLVAKLLTDLPGSSQWFERGVVTYSDRAKQDLLGVPAGVLERHGAVSEETACAMVQGLLASAPAQWALAVTGIAGPSGGSAAKPVGTVWIAWARRGEPPRAQRFLFSGSRAAVRDAAAVAALAGLAERLGRQ